MKEVTFEPGLKDILKVKLGWEQGFLQVEKLYKYLRKSREVWKAFGK